MKIISLGGSIIIPKASPTSSARFAESRRAGKFNIPFLKKFRRLILDEVKRGEKFLLIVGGGATCRQYQEAAKKVVAMTNEDLDWLGIQSTIFNAHFVRALFKDYAYERVVTDPRKKIKTDKPIILGAGWGTGHSTDMDAVMHAKAHHAKEIINLSNIEYVYTKDPNKFKDAQKIDRIDWGTFRKRIVGNTWVAGKNAPFDPIASREAERFGLTVKMVKGTDLTEVKKALSGKKFKGTVIS